VNNAVKHTEPTTIVTQLFKTRARLELTIVNDGKEYAPSGNSSGMGLKIMDYRARAIGGKLHVSAGLAGETKVNVSVPAVDVK
jgi:signal transduction histidine kinase